MFFVCFLLLFSFLSLFCFLFCFFLSLSLSLFFFFLFFFFARLQLGEHELKLSKALKKVVMVKAASYSLIRKSNSND